MDKARPKLEKLLAVLEQVLGESDYLLGSFSLVDCAFAPYLPYLDLEHRPTLHAYGQRVMARPSFKASHER
jgi:glutathione S-transferase